MFVVETVYQGYLEVFGNSLRLLSFYFEEKVTQIIKDRGASGLSVTKTWRFIFLSFFFFNQSNYVPRSSNWANTSHMME